MRKNLRKVPADLRLRIQSMETDEVVVGCVRRIPKTDIERGDFENLGIRYEDGRLAVEGAVLPEASAGRYSDRNVNGYIVKRTDLPMTTLSRSFDTPNFGDWGLGSHEVTFEQDVYQREIHPPRELGLTLEVLGEDATTGQVVVRIAVDDVLDRRDTDFEGDLLFDLNLLQENVGSVDVFPATASRSEYLSSLYVDWEILPPGQQDNVDRILAGVKAPSPELREQVTERYDFLMSLRPTGIVRGASGFRRYFGAQFGDECVVFENVEYGNALYVMFEDWRRLSQMSRLELRADMDNSRDFVRVEHRRGWKSKLRAIVRKKRTDRPQRS
jgi:hypothetical protein